MKFRLCRIVLAAHRAARRRPAPDPAASSPGPHWTDLRDCHRLGRRRCARSDRHRQEHRDQLTRDAVTGADGTFVFPDLLAGTYDIKVTLEGFKTYEQQRLKLGQRARRAARDRARGGRAVGDDLRDGRGGSRPDAKLRAIGPGSRRSSSRRSTLKGRDYMGMLKLLPGVVDTANREAPGWNNIGGLAINGGATTPSTSPTTA